jgi:predicted MFS family arabinose efflux permease
MTFSFARLRALLRLPGAHSPLGNRGILAILVFLQLCHTLDFVLLMPLGPTLIRTLEIDPREFGALVSSYTFSAAVSGLLLASIIDRFDRKRALLSLATGFAVATLACGVAPTYSLLLIARTVAGFFGGVMTALAYAIVGDVIPMQKRGAAVGLLSLAFSITSIVGIPLGLWLSRSLNWQAPFLVIGVVSLGVIAGAALVLPPIRGHLSSSSSASKNGFETLKEVFLTRSHWNAFALMVLLNLSAFSLIPYISASLVGNVGIAESDLYLTYLVGGSVTFFTARFIGHWSDRVGKLYVFRRATLASIVPILLISHLPVVPLAVALLCTTLFMVGMNARFVPAVTLTTSVAEPRLRGGFLAVNSSLQQIAMGLGSAATGLVLVKGTGGKLLHFEWAGVFSALVTVATFFVSARLASVERDPSLSSRKTENTPEINLPPAAEG